MEGLEIHFIEDEKVVEKTLRRPVLWDLMVSPSSKVKASFETISVHDSDFYPDKKCLDKWGGIDNNRPQIKLTRGGRDGS